MRRYKYLIVFLLAVLATGVLLYRYGFNFEETARNLYRKKVCDCDTMRIKEYVDSAGVPYLNYYSTAGFYIGEQRNPVTICFKALEYASIDEQENLFGNCVKALNAIAVERDSAVFFKYNFPWLYQLKPPWYSAMAQGCALKVYLKAFTLYKDSTYLNTTIKIRNSFLIPVDSGGITYINGKNKWWYEEYAQSGNEKPMVLNGMMYALDGLYEYYLVTGDTIAESLFEKGINSLKDNLAFYDKGSRSYYDRLGTEASDYYHLIHIQFLEKFYKITGAAVFNEYAVKWKQFKTRCFIRELFTKPNKSSVLITSILLFSFLVIFYLISKKIFGKK